MPPYVLPPSMFVKLRLLPFPDSSLLGQIPKFVKREGN